MYIISEFDLNDDNDGSNFLNLFFNNKIGVNNIWIWVPTFEIYYWHLK